MQPQISRVLDTVVSQQPKGFHILKSTLKGSGGSLGVTTKMPPPAYLAPGDVQSMPPGPSQAPGLSAITVPFYRWRSQGSGQHGLQAFTLSLCPPGSGNSTEDRPRSHTDAGPGLRLLATAASSQRYLCKPRHLDRHLAGHCFAPLWLMGDVSLHSVGVGHCVLPRGYKDPSPLAQAPPGKGRR